MEGACVSRGKFRNRLKPNVEIRCMSYLPDRHWSKQRSRQSLIKTTGIDSVVSMFPVVLAGVIYSTILLITISSDLTSVWLLVDVVIVQSVHSSVRHSVNWLKDTGAELNSNFCWFRNDTGQLLVVQSVLERNHWCSMNSVLILILSI